LRGPSEALVEIFHAAKDLAVGHYPLASKVEHPVVPLENFLRVRYGTCLHQALFASLLLKKAGVPHRLVNGATRAVGHTWIELGDGRILDPALGKLERPHPSEAWPGWIKYGDAVVFEDQVWPYLALD
jgi:hypothetical protein